MALPTLRYPPGNRMTGRELTRAIQAAATEHGWRFVHFHPAGVRSGRWVTPYSGDGGFPDLVLARKGAVLVLEVKGKGDQVRAGQLEWLMDAGAPWGGDVVAGFVGKRELDAVLAHLAGRSYSDELVTALRPRFERARQ